MREPFILLYQCGIANVYVPSLGRVYQGDYRTAENICRGILLAGKDVEIKHWDGAGDASLFRDAWGEGEGDLWAEQKRVPGGAIAHV